MTVMTSVTAPAAVPASPPPFLHARLARRDLSSVPGSPPALEDPPSARADTEPNGDPGLLRVCL
jgi:hypothetical protein